MRAPHPFVFAGPGLAPMPRRRLNARVVTGLAILSVAMARPMPIPAQGLEYVKDKYTKSEYQIPMRDGVRLFTAVYAPKDQSQRYPIMLLRTPYSVQPYGPNEYRSDLGPSSLFG